MVDNQKEYKLYLNNVSCSSCVAHINKALSQLDGIEEYSVNFSERELFIKASIDSSDVISILKKIGYNSQLVNTNDYIQEKDFRMTKKKNLDLKRFLVSGILGVFILVSPLFYFIPSLDGYYQDTFWSIKIDIQGQYFWLFISIISVFVLWYSAKHIYSSAFKSLLNHHATMDTLISVGTISAWCFSVIVIIFPDSFPTGVRNIYFDASLLVIALVNLGAFLESNARGKTSEAIRSLMDLQPKTALLVAPNGEEKKVLIKQLVVGDTIRVYPGEKIALDGIVIKGRSYIDESMLTGESLPVEKEKDSKVYAGTINKGGSFLFNATNIGKETALANIIKMVQDAQATKPSIAKIADSVSAYFVPTVLILAIITGLIWYNLGFSASYVLVATMSVLVIACPCALGLATPISVIVGMGQAAKRGILIRNGDALQKANQLTSIVLDKTGTITKGKPEVMDIQMMVNTSIDDIVKVAASVESSSEHPLGQAIVQYAKEQKIDLVEVDDFYASTGYGVVARLNSHLIYIGNESWMKKNGITISLSQADIAIKLANKGYTPMYIGKGAQLMGIISVADPIKEDAKESILTFKNLGLKVIMLTGDNKLTANIIAEQIGIDYFLAEVLPEDKKNKIEKMQGEGQVVAMVGDGVNDSPALAQADMGFAIGSGADVASESSDITLMHDSLLGIVQAMVISSATMRNIKQNLVGAFIYNIIGIPIAAGILFPFTGVLLNPIIAAAAMAASSLTVVMNANSLRMIKL